MPVERKPTNMAGIIVGRLLILPTYRYVDTGKKKRVQWQCLCDPELGGCGNVKWMFRDHLLNTRTKGLKTCGICTSNTHGMSDTPEYRAWINMHQRCYNPKNVSYADYGGRGIQVDAVWHDFLNFFHDMGRRPSDQHSLDKVNNYANYGPGNCVWATTYEQNQNRRNN